MTNVLIRNVPEDDLDRFRAAAAEQGTSLQTFLLDVVRAHASYLRRQDALGHIAHHLNGRAEVPETERQAVLDAIGAAHNERADQVASPQVE